MKQVVKIRRRDGVTQRYRVGKRQRVRKMAVSPGEMKKLLSKEDPGMKEFKNTFSQLSKQQLESIKDRLEGEDIAEMYGLPTGKDKEAKEKREIILDQVKAEKSARWGKKMKIPDSPGWKDFAKANPDVAKTILSKEESEEKEK